MTPTLQHQGSAAASFPADCSWPPNLSAAPTQRVGHLLLTTGGKRTQDTRLRALVSALLDGAHSARLPDIWARCLEQLRRLAPAGPAAPPGTSNSNSSSTRAQDGSAPPLTHPNTAGYNTSRTTVSLMSPPRASAPGQHAEANPAKLTASPQKAIEQRATPIKSSELGGGQHLAPGTAQHGGREQGGGWEEGVKELEAWEVNGLQNGIVGSVDSSAVAAGHGTAVRGDVGNQAQQHAQQKVYGSGDGFAAVGYNGAREGAAMEAYAPTPQVLPHFKAQQAQQAKGRSSP